MDTKKLVSVRISEEDLSKIDEICKYKSYRKRSDFIQEGVKAIIAIHEAGLFPKVMKYSPQFGDVIDEIKFEYHRQVK